MNKITTTNKPGTLTSMEVSEMIGKEHSKLLRDIRRYSSQLGEAKIGFTDFWKESTYEDIKGKIRPCYTITNKGCEFISNKLTGKKGTEFAAKHILLNNSTSTKNKTPIEIALKIDELGMTTASNLYSFLELEQKNFSHWCSRNIKNNKFSIENKDYIVFVQEDENPIGGRPKQDYKITSNFAKKLSMTGNTEKHEEARKYFIACEKGLEIATQRLKTDNQVVLQELINSMTTLTNTISLMQQDIKDLKQNQRNRYLENKYPSAWYKKISPKYEMLTDYFDCSRRELYSNIYKELEDTYDIDINQIHEDYCYENNLLKSECYPMEAIEHNMKLRDAITLLIDTNLVKYGLQTEEELKNFKRETLFDKKPC